MFAINDVSSRNSDQLEVHDKHEIILFGVLLSGHEFLTQLGTDWVEFG
jgi:hypothetical protein